MSAFYTGLRKRVVLLSSLLIVLTWIASSLATRAGIEQASDEQLAQRAQAVAWLMVRAASQTDEPVTGDALIRQLDQIGDSLGETMSYEFGRSSGDQALRSSSFPDLSEEEAIDGFSRHSQGGERWRIFTAVSEDQQTWSRVAFRPAEPKPLTEMLLLTLKQPLVWAITLLGLLAIAIQNRCFTPLKKIEDALAEQDLLNPRPLALEPARLPRDMRPLVTQLDRILDQTKNLLEEQRTFAYGVGHELRTPLAGCLSQVQVAQRIEDPSRLKQSLAKAERALLQMTQLVDQLLLARTDPSAPLENPTRITLSALVQDSIERRTVTAQREGVVLKWRVDGSHDSEIKAKPELIRTLLTNLIDNAIRYSPRGGEILTRVDCNDERWLVLSVSDQGSGIDADENIQIFSPFYQSETGKSSGLGLAIVRAIVKAHGGDVSAHRRPMLGTEIRVVLPRA